MTNFSEAPHNPDATKPPINLLRGWPHPSLLPKRQLHDAADAAFADPSVITPGLLYAPDLGFAPLRANIAAWLTAFFRPAAGAVALERIAISGGASQGLGCLLQAFADPAFTRGVWMVAPTYMLAPRIFEDAGLAGGGGTKLRGVPEDEEGIDLGFLQREIARRDREAEAEEEQQQQQQQARKENKGLPERFKPERPWAKLYRHIIYAVPTFANPSSRTMSLRRREQLVRLAREVDALVVCDDVYDFLQWPAGSTSSAVYTGGIDRAALPRVVDVDRFLDGGAEREGADGFGNVVSNGSFSKLAGPGLRTGWIEGTEKLAFGVSQCGTTRSGGAPSQITATFLSHLLATGSLQQHILSVLQPTYARRYRAMLAALETHLLPLGASLPQRGGRDDDDVAGGYFCWVTLPHGVAAEEVAGRALEEENLVVAKGAMFEVPGDGEGEGLEYANQLRLCFAWEDEERLAEGVERLAAVVGRILKGESKGSGGAGFADSEFW